MYLAVHPLVNFQIRVEKWIDDVVIKELKINEEELKSDFILSQDKKEIRASHILVKVEADADKETKEKAKQKIEEILIKVKAGENFSELAKNNSDCPSKEMGGDLNFFGRNSMAKPFEKAAYALKKGDISGVVETQFGYHIIKKTDEREGPRTIRASHILVKTQGLDEKGKAEAKTKIDGILKKITDGGDFAALAKEHSDCPSKNNGGDLNFFGKGRMDPAFEKAAFDLKKKDEVSAVVLSSFGYHIIKLTDCSTFKKEWNAKVKEEFIKMSKREEIGEYIEDSIKNIKKDYSLELTK